MKNVFKKYIGKDVIIRSGLAGVFIGEYVCLHMDGKFVELNNVRKIWRWEGACAVEQVAIDGVKKGNITVVVDNMIIADPVQIIPCTPKASENIRGFEAWVAE